MALASIQQVLAINPIDGADRIELATINGWECVVKKGEFSQGDLGVYFEIDSVVPDKEWSKFLESKKFRIKTASFKKQISQGLLMPLNSVFEAGMDLTEVLGVEKYEKPVAISLRGLVAGNFPSHLISKTDELNLQSHLRSLDWIRGKEIYETVKLDGTSATYITHTAGEETKHYICSRNMQYKEDQEGNVYVNIYKNSIQKALQEEKNLAIQGELVGPGIQKNTLGLPDYAFYIFSIKDLVEKRYYGIDEIEAFCKKHELNHVPIVERYVAESQHDLTWFKSRCGGSNMFNGREREGIVVRTTTHEGTGMISFKVLNPKYLLKED